MSFVKDGTRSRSALLDGGGGGGGGTIPTPIPDDTSLPIWGDDSDGSMQYESGSDALRVQTADRGATGSANILVRTDDSATGPAGGLGLATGRGLGGAQAAVTIGDQTSTVGQSETMPRLLPRSSGLRLDGGDLTANRYVIQTQHQQLPNISPTPTAYPDDPAWSVVETAGSGVPLANYGGIGLNVIAAAGAGDGAVLSPQTGNTNAWAGFVMDRTLELILKQNLFTDSTVLNQRYESGGKVSPVAAFGADNGAGSPAAFFRYDASVSPNWFAITDPGGAPNAPVDTGIAVAADTGYMLAMAFVGDDVLFFINGANVASSSLTGAPSATGMRPYVGVSRSDAVLSLIRVLGQAVSRNGA